MEVSAPTVAALSTPRVDDSEVKQLREQVSRLADLVVSLPRANRFRHHSSSRNRPPANMPPPSQPPPQDTIMPSSVMMAGSVGIPAAGDRKTPRPDAHGDRRSWLSLFYEVIITRTHAFSLTQVPRSVSSPPPPLIANSCPTN